MTTYLDTTGAWSPKASVGYKPGDYIICRPPAASGLPQHVYRVLRGGSDPLFEIFNGVLAQSAVATTVTGTTAETVLASVIVPGGLVGPNGSLRITPIWSSTNNGNAKTGSVKFGGVSHAAHALASALSAGSMFTIRNRGVLNSQITYGGAPGTVQTVSNTTSSIDTSVDQVLQITGTLATGTDSLTLEGYTVELDPA